MSRLSERMSQYPPASDTVDSRGSREAGQDAEGSRSGDTAVDMGDGLCAQGRFGEAIEQYRNVLEQDPQQVAVYVRLGNAFYGIGNPAGAAEVYRMALELEPEHAEAHNNLGVVLKDLGCLEEAEQHLHRAVTLRPDYADALTNLGNVLKLGGQPALAIDYYRRALEHQPSSAPVYSNVGNALVALGREAEAAELYDIALDMDPELAAAHWNRALLWLQKGDFARGWPEYEWGFAAGERLQREFLQPRWQGEPLAGRRLLVWSEQGFGDTLQFVRYVPALRDLGARVVLECPSELVALVRDSGLADEVVESGGDENCDFHTPLLSLPALLGASQRDIPGSDGYLQADPERVTAWRDRLRSIGGLRIGVAWSGNPRQPVNRLRACPPAPLLAALGSVPGVTLFSLQKTDGVDVAPEATVVDFTAELNDFADTAALMMNLDLIVTVDTAVAHLAGALGRKVWTLLSRPADWRWLGRGDDTPWYGSMRLLTQTQAGDWDSVLEQLRAPLAAVGGDDTGAPVAVSAPEQARAGFNRIHDQTYGARLTSAREVLTSLFDLLRPGSVLDVGCGLGAWLEVAKGRGVGDVLGVDGPWIEQQRVRLASNEFQHHDLERPLDLGRRFELVISLEVAEHLHPECAESFVDSLVRHGDAVLFSAAVPGQGGNGHLNEQLQHYWAGLFAKHDYLPVDVVRPRVWLNANVFWWLQQNTVLYVRGQSLARWPALRPLVVERPEALSIIHPELYARSLRALAAAQAGPA
jgi:Tfp pilus assembly protein PilF/SAM-dependent methyltransferase